MELEAYENVLYQLYTDESLSELAVQLDSRWIRQWYAISCGGSCAVYSGCRIICVHYDNYQGRETVFYEAVPNFV